MTNVKMHGYFTAPCSTLEQKRRERERVAACAERNAQHYASILRQMDDEIATLEAKESVTL